MVILFTANMVVRLVVVMITDAVDTNGNAGSTMMEAPMMVAMAAAVDYGQWLVDDDSSESGIEAVGRKGAGVRLSCGVVRSLSRRRRANDVLAE